jgi:hypothetical protein
VPRPFRGVIDDITQSVPDWEPYTQPIAPEGSPNVLYIVLDDVGYSAMQPFGGFIETQTRRHPDAPLRRRQDRPALRLLVLHDDADREFEYTAGAEASLEQAEKHGWTVVSMKNDWKTVFAEA